MPRACLSGFSTVILQYHVQRTNHLHTSTRQGSSNRHRFTNAIRAPKFPFLSRCNVCWFATYGARPYVHCCTGRSSRYALPKFFPRCTWLFSIGQALASATHVHTRLFTGLSNCWKVSNVLFFAVTLALCYNNRSDLTLFGLRETK